MLVAAGNPDAESTQMRRQFAERDKAPTRERAGARRAIVENPSGQHDCRGAGGSGTVVVGHDGDLALEGCSIEGGSPQPHGQGTVLGAEWVKQERKSKDKRRIALQIFQGKQLPQAGNSGERVVNDVEFHPCAEPDRARPPCLGKQIQIGHIAVVDPPARGIQTTARRPSPGA